jgi:hypothetical protein
MTSNLYSPLLDTATNTLHIANAAQHLDRITSDPATLVQRTNRNPATRRLPLRSYQRRSLMEHNQREGRYGRIPI